MKIPTKEEVLAAVVNELALEEIKIGGDINAFQEVLYTGFLKFIKRRKYQEEMLEEFVISVVDELLEPEEPHSINGDLSPNQKPTS